MSITKNWWKWLSMILLYYTLVAGLMVEVPRLPILHESIRNLYFHVPMWFGMLTLYAISFAQSIMYLKNNTLRHDIRARAFAETGLLYGVLGLLTGSLWARYTWGAWWTNDPKLNAAAIGMLMYLAYFVLRGSMEDPSQRAKIAAVYNILAFLVLVPLLFVIPRLTDSLHPGNGGNPGFNSYDLDNDMRWVFYPAVLGWILLGVWMAVQRRDLYELESNIEHADN